MPNKDNPKPFITFTNIGNQIYVPNFREGGLTQEVINSGNLKLLRDFFNARAAQLTLDELDYLTARIAAAEEFERLNKEAMRNLAEGKDHPVPQTDNNGGYTGFSNLVYPDKQTSTNGCWSCAYSLLLKSRGVDVSQEKIRAWRPDYAKTQNSETPAAANLWYMRNADTEMDIINNVDMLTQVLPNTAMANFTIPPLVEDHIALINPKTNKPVAMEQKHREALRKYHKAEVIRNLRETITGAIEKDHSPVAIVVDGHYITVTGINKKTGALRYEDSAVLKGEKTTYSMTLEDLYHIGFEQHDKEVYVNTTVTIPPKGVSLSWLQDLKVPEYSKDKISKPDYGANNDVITVDAEGNAKLDIPANDPYRTKGGDIKNGNITTLGIMTMPAMNLKPLENKLGLKLQSYGVNGGYTLGDMDIYYPTRVCAKNDPRLLKDQSLEKNKQMKYFGNELIRLAGTNELGNKPWAKELQKYGNMIILLTRDGISAQSKAKAAETLKGLSAFLSKKDGEKSILKTIFDNGYVLDRWDLKAELIRDFNVLNDKLGLGIDTGAAMGKPAGTPYTEGDAKTDAEMDYYLFNLKPERIVKNDANRVAAEESLAYLLALKQLRKDKYETLHAYPPKANEITLLKNDIKKTAAWTQIKEMGVENFMALGTAPDEIFANYRQISGAVYNQNMNNIAADNNNKVSSFSGAASADDDDDFTLLKDEKTVPAPKAPAKNTQLPKNDVLKDKLGLFDSTTAALVPEIKGENAKGSHGNIIENAPAPDETINSIKRALEAGKNDKVSKKAYKDILKALNEYEASYSSYKAVKGNPYAGLTALDEREFEKVQNDPYGMEEFRYDAVNTAILDVQEKNRALAETISKHIDAAAALKGNDAYKLVLDSAKAAAEGVRYFLDDQQMANDLDHVKNERKIQDEQIREGVNKERRRLENNMLNSKNDIENVFLFNKSNALAEICDIALAQYDNKGNNVTNTLSEIEKQKAAVSVGNLLFDKMCQKFPEMKKKVNTPRTQEQYEAAVDDIMATQSFADLISGLDREGLRHIVGTRKGREDLFKNFIKDSYMTKEEAAKISHKKASPAYKFINDNSAKKNASADKTNTKAKNNTAKKK